MQQISFFDNEIGKDEFLKLVKDIKLKDYIFMLWINGNLKYF